MRIGHANRYALVLFLSNWLLVRSFRSQSSLWSSDRTSIATSRTCLDEFRVVSKRPGRVVRDPKTGFYRPNRKLIEERPKVKEGPSAWDSFKATLYGSIDGAKSLPEKIQRVTKRNDPAASAVIVDGYSQVQQRVYESGGSPGKRLLEEYEQRYLAETEDDTIVKPNLFQSLKGAWYGTVDAANRIVPASAKMDVTDIDFETFKPVVKSSFASSQEVQESLQDLQSDNPVRKVIARYRISEWDRKEKSLAAEIDRYRKARQVKEVVYSVGDAVQTSALAIAEVPAQVSSQVEQIAAFLASLPATFQNVLDSINAIPTQVEEKASQVQQSVQQGIETTQKVVQEVQAIPTKVQRTAQATQQAAVKTIEVVDDTVNRGKVLLGLAKPVPRPPNSPPPPELTLKDIGWKVAGGVASGATKVAWWTAKGVALLTWKGATLAVEKGIEAFKEQQEAETQQVVASTSSQPTTVSKPSKPTTTSAAPVKPTIPPPPEIKLTPLASASLPLKEKKDTPVSERKPSDVVVERRDDLDRQVEEALRLAEEALRMAEKQEETSST